MSRAVELAQSEPSSDRQGSSNPKKRKPEKMKKKIFAIFALLLAVTPLIAQPQGWNGGWHGQQQQASAPQGQQQGRQQPKFDPQEFTKRMEGYIAMKAGLSREESDKFFPIYREFKQKQRELTFKQQRLQREKPANDKDYDNVITQIAELSVQIAKLEQTYYPKLCKVITAKKMYNVLQAENDFHRDLVRQPMQMGNGQKPQQWNGNGQGQRPQQWGNGQRPQQWGNGQRPQQWGGGQQQKKN